MPRFFLSYRCEDGQAQAALLRAAGQRAAGAQRLRAADGDIWTEANPNLRGEDLAVDVRVRLLDCDALLALIGPRWLGPADPLTGASCLSDRHDPVHCAIATALRVGVPVIPILIDGSSLPAASAIPPDLQALRHRRAATLRTRRFKADARRLFKSLTPQKLGRTGPGGYGRRNSEQASWTSRLIALSLIGSATSGTTLVVSGSFPDVRDKHASAEAATPSFSPAHGTLTLPASEGAASPLTNPPVHQAIDEVYSIAPGDTLTLNSASNAPAGPRRITSIDDRPVRVGEIVQLRHGGRLTIGDPALAFTAGAAVGNEAFTYTALADNGQATRASVTIRIAGNQKRIGPGAPDTFRDCASCPDMVVIPPGTFLMGSPLDEIGRYEDEGPQRRVRIKGFAAGVYEVTWTEYEACVHANACPAPADDGFGKGLKPVTNISWFDAKAYVRWLSHESGKHYRLLSEAEWEYAARAGSQTPFSFGQAISDSDANFDATKVYGDGQAGRRRATTLPVGAFSPNPFGLYDMHGNVLEWVEDCYAESYAIGQPTNGDAFTPATCVYQIARGGSWANDPSLLRSALRAGDPATARMKNLGVRVARDL